jgi:hypothetical protein
VYVHFLKPEFGKIMTTRSCLVGTDDLHGRPKANLLVILVLQGRLHLSAVKEDFMVRLINLKDKKGDHVHPELQQTIQFWMGYLFWKWDPKFSPDNHFEERLDPVNEDSVNELSTKLLKKPWKRGQSPWEAIVFPHYKTKFGANHDKTLVFFRLHHSMADGFSVIKLLAGDLALETKIKLPTPDRFEQTRYSLWREIKSTIIFCFVSPYEMTSSLIEAWDRNDAHIPEHKLSENISLAFSERIPISVIKNIKNGHGVSFTGLLLAAFTGAVRDFMLENGFKVPEAIHGVLPFPLPGHPEKLRNFM